jgi:putative tryptophan/tyrosine transport system substrate-binding protein
MRRRDLLILLASAAHAPGRPARGQQRPMPVIGFLSSGSAEGFATLLQAFREGLKRAGYSEGDNVAIDYVWAAGRYEQLPALAADLVGKKPVVIAAAGGAVAALAAKRATSTIPIVMAVGDDPVRFGLVGSLARPEANITGITLFMAELTPKRLELLTELLPDAALAMLSNPQNPNAVHEAADARDAAARSGRELEIAYASSDAEIEAAITRIAGRPGVAMMVGIDPYFYSRREQIVEWATRHRVPAIYFHRGFAAAGGLLSYGATITEEYSAAGYYTGRILAGAKPADLPILQPSKVELVLNLRTAKALGITVPASILVRADDVIE